jgi:hypothetical protein
MFARAAAYTPALQRRWETRAIPIVGPSAQGEAGKLGTQRSINFYPIKPERQGDPWTLRGTPGLDLLDTLPRSPVRGAHVHRDRLFAVAGARVYEVYADGSSREWGQISSTRGRVGLASLLNVIVIGDGTRYYALDLDAGTCTAITDAPRGRFPVFFNQRILYAGENGQVYYSELNDPTNIPGANVFTAESLPDEIEALTTTEDQIWLHGSDSTEVWYDSGDADDPFARIPGGAIYSGCGHPNTALRVDNSVWWVERDKEGAGIVRRANGFTPVRVSTSPIERFLKGATNVSAYSYQEDGHTFYVINADEGTRAFDIKEGEWHDRAWLNPATGEQERQRQEFHSYCYGAHIVFDYETGGVYRQGLDLYTDAGQEIRSTRVSQVVGFGGRQTHIAELWLDFAAGVGIDGGGQGSAPLVMLRCARDAASFDNEHTAPLGAIGEFGTQVRFFDLGIGRDWVFEVSVSDPVLKGLLGAEATVQIGRR